MPYVIGESCIDIMDKSCVEECPVDCIYEGGRMLYIHPDECIDCGACEPACPMDAIVSTRTASDKWDLFQTASREVFDEIGAPGGSYKLTAPVEDPVSIQTFEKNS